MVSSLSFCSVLTVFCFRKTFFADMNSKNSVMFGINKKIILYLHAENSAFQTKR